MLENEKLLPEENTVGIVLLQITSGEENGGCPSSRCIISDNLAYI
jgi:hypothetical protein